MNRRQKASPRRPQDWAYRRAFERLDVALEANTESDCSERTNLLGIAIFGDLWREPEPDEPADIAN